MKAIVQDIYGSPDVLQLREIDKPVVGEDDVLVHVHAAGVDQGVWHLMAGLPYLVRVAGVGLRAPKNPVRGVDVGGRVEAVGENVIQFQPGDEVFGTCRGSFAEYASARADQLAPKPANLTFEQAAAVPVSGCTALQAVRDRGKVRPGQRVLIIGAGGGVGTFAVQLAKAFGAEVTGVASRTKLELVRSIGADRVIDYTRGDFAEDRNRYDVILDIAGNRSLSHLRRALALEGTLVLSRFVRQKLSTWIATQPKEDLEALHELLEAGKITPVVDRTFRLSEVPEAIRYLREGRAHGKVVITV